MPERAKVSSIEAIESFRASLIVYLEKARAALDDIGDDVSRTRSWLSDERRTFWEGELRRRNRKLEEKQAALFDARIGEFKKSTLMEHAEMQRAKRERDEAAGRYDMVKKWNKQYDSRVQPVAKDIDKLHDVLVRHMGEAVLYLTRVTAALAAYAEVPPPDSGPATAPIQEAGEP